MNILKLLNKYKEVCLNHYDELAKNVYGSKSKKMVVFMNRTVSSKSIWGGNGDRDEDLYIGIDENGWVKYNLLTENGMYEKNDGFKSPMSLS